MRGLEILDGINKRKNKKKSKAKNKVKKMFKIPSLGFEGLSEIGMKLGVIIKSFSKPIRDFSTSNKTFFSPLTSESIELNWEYEKDENIGLLVLKNDKKYSSLEDISKICDELFSD